MSSLYGSICLSEIPRSQMKKVMCKDGKERIFLNIFVGEKKSLQRSVITRTLTLCHVHRRRKSGLTVSSISLVICKRLVRNRASHHLNRWQVRQAFLLKMIYLSNHVSLRYV